MKRILVIDDDPEIPRIISQICDIELPANLLHAPNGLDGVAYARAEEVDLIILDLTLPDLSGLDVCKKIREEGLNTPIICLTSRADPIDKIVGFENGADDYVTKPFHPRELIARMKAVLRRTGDSPQKIRSTDTIVRGRLRIELQSHRAFFDEQELDISSTEFALIALLADNQGRVFSREDLLSGVLGYTTADYDHSITSHISRIRSKIEPDPDRPTYIRTVRGVGYRFATDDEIAAANGGR